MTRFDASQIRGYYDRQTAGFLAGGQGGAAGAIHRAVWGPGVDNRDQAFHFVEERLADVLGDGLANGGRPAHVVDLGCGVGGSLTYLASRLPITGTGVTLSPVQAGIAAERIRAMGLSDRVRCVEGDYTQLPSSVAPADLAFAIESFVHGPSPTAFLSECARVIRPGGWLMVCDDFLRPTAAAGAGRVLDQFRRGWHVNTLVTRDELIGWARAAGFTLRHTVDLTPWLEINRPRDRAIAVLVAACGWLPMARARLGHLVGGAALQRALARGWIGYELLAFTRT